MMLQCMYYRVQSLIEKLRERVLPLLSTREKYIKGVNLLVISEHSLTKPYQVIQRNQQTLQTIILPTLSMKLSYFSLVVNAIVVASSPVQEQASGHILRPGCYTCANTYRGQDNAAVIKARVSY